MNEWIKVEDKLPDFDQTVIFYFEYGGMFHGCIDKDDDLELFLKGVTHTGRITHWIDLEGPKQEDK
jgi:hypothetical protein